MPTSLFSVPGVRLSSPFRHCGLDPQSPAPPSVIAGSTRNPPPPSVIAGIAKQNFLRYSHFMILAQKVNFGLRSKRFTMI